MVPSMDQNEKMKFILDNLIEMKQCNECHGMWFHFSSNDSLGYYRLSPVAPCDCSICHPLDQEIESGAIMTEEGWISLD